MRFKLRNNAVLHTIRTSGETYSTADPFIDLIFEHGIAKDAVAYFAKESR